jgi:hypothetical protein
LDASQGINLVYPENGNQYGFYLLYMKGIKNKAMRSLINYIGLALLLCAYDLKRGEKNLDVFYEKGTTFRGVTLLGNASTSENFFYDMFLAAGTRHEECILAINQGLFDLSKKRIPWEVAKNQAYFTDQLLRSKMEYFKNKIKEKKITISTNLTYTSPIERSVYWMRKLGYFEKINAMLDKEGKPSWKRSRSGIQKWVNQIVENWELSTIPAIIRAREINIFNLT